ncbi:MAG: hypothetical protein ACFFDK_00725 [Promethearchaeota archaeon]
MIKKRDFVHQNIKYSFNWNLKNHKEKLTQLNSNREEFKRLGNYLKNIYHGSIPNNIFNTKTITRVSQFKVRGLKNGFLRSFSKRLINEGKIQRFDSNSKLPNFAKKVYEIYHLNQINKNPGHETILKNILIKDKDSIAIEVPIWSVNKNKHITGHIDLIQIENDVIKIIDYKPEGNFLFSLPQVATYGLLLKKIIHVENLTCISFNKSAAWEYNPEILLIDIKNLLNSKRIPRIWEDFL